MFVGGALSFCHAYPKWLSRYFSHYWLHLICVVLLIDVSRPLLFSFFLFLCSRTIFFLFLPLCKESDSFTTFLQKHFLVFFGISFSFIQEVCHPIQWIYCGRPFLVFLYFQPYLKGLLAYEIILDLLFYVHPYLKGIFAPFEGFLYKILFLISFSTSTLL